MIPWGKTGLAATMATALTAALSLGACHATAQAPSDALSAAPSPRSDAPTTPATPPDEPRAGSGSSSPPGSLSRELDRSGGVIEPPEGVDPRMPHPSPPAPGAAPRTPVVPPPGTP